MILNDDFNNNDNDYSVCNTIEFMEIFLIHLIRDKNVFERTKELDLNIDIFGDRLTGITVYREFADIALTLNITPIPESLFRAAYASKVQQGRLDPEDKGDLGLIERIYSDALSAKEYVLRAIPAFIKERKLAHLQFKHRDNVEKLVAEVQKVLASESGLPSIRTQRERAVEAPVRPEELIKGILHVGSKLILGGGSKSFKTFSLLDLGLSVASGISWWNWSCKKQRVLYINFEIHDAFFCERIQRICDAKGIAVPLDDFHDWGLRGFAADIDKLLPEILKRTKAEGYGLVIFDPVYKLLGDRDENAAGDIGSLMNALEQVAVKTGAAVAIGNHYSKGNQAAKNAMDRIAGSGTFARDADSLVMLTPHQEENCFTIDCVLRNNPPIPSFVMKWDYPLMKKQVMLDPKQLKGAAGRARLYSADDLLPFLTGSMSCTEWMNATVETTAMGKSTFYYLKKELTEQGKVALKDEMWSRLLPNGETVPTISGATSVSPITPK